MLGTLPYSSNLLCFFKCCAHLEDSESLRVLQLLDCHGIKTAQDLEACYSNSPDVVIRCFGTAGLETETISHVITCIEDIAASGVLTTPLFVKTAGGHRQAPGVGLDIDTPCSKLPSRCDTGENTPYLDDEIACLRAMDATQKTKVTSCPERIRWRRASERNLEYEEEPEVYSPASDAIHHLSSSADAGLDLSKCGDCPLTFGLRRVHSTCNLCDKQFSEQKMENCFNMTHTSTGYRAFQSGLGLKTRATRAGSEASLDLSRGRSSRRTKLGLDGGFCGSGPQSTESSSISAGSRIASHHELEQAAEEHEAQSNTIPNEAPKIAPKVGIFRRPGCLMC